ncbi:MAG: hypothetical protein M0R46_10545 [Candidatus Muirbacterium halophilum]|nr:hypothetical protein [Candidatus Muirbacterium halophilum]
MAYKEFGATIAPANISGTGFPIAMGSHIGGGRTINDKSNLKLWQLLGDGVNITEQKANAIGQIWYDRSDGKYYKLTGFTGDIPNWVEYLDTSNINGTTNYVTKFTGTNSIGNSLIYDNGTNVGIGTTNPNNRLTIISGDNKDTGPILNLSGDSVNQVESGRIRFSETIITSSNYQGAFIHYNGASNVFNIGVHEASNGLTTSDLNSIVITRSNGDVNIGNSSMYVKYGGNVGIGTTSPYEKLEVVGNIETDHIKLNNSVTFLDNSAEKGGMRYNIINKTIEFFFI